MASAYLPNSLPLIVMSAVVTSRSTLEPSDLRIANGMDAVICVYLRFRLPVMVTIFPTGEGMIR